MSFNIYPWCVDWFVSQPMESTTDTTYLNYENKNITCKNKRLVDFYEKKKEKKRTTNNGRF